MTRFVLCFLLLCLSCRLARPATAQAISPLAPVVVKLLPGDIVREPLIGLDEATYQAGRRAVQLVPAADAVQADLRREAALAHQQLATTEQALRECRASRTATEADYQLAQKAVTVALASPPRPPWLLDSHTYKGAGLGAVAMVLLKLVIFH